ncbi:hypothetical protein PG997_008713 [Apiospora hydei]|uniref:Uncharacterized protein n=1 Tax=Apiospora hydei TaxID=1337664 RepID=A0ABR1WBL0_9PEZI
MTDPAKYWPGGIPDDVRCHPDPFNGDLGLPATPAAQETAIGRNEVSDTEEVDDNFEVTQRRNLMCQWARMTQDERDSYQSRAPVRHSAGWYPSEELADPSVEVGSSHTRTYRHEKGAEDKSVVCITATAAAAAAAAAREEGSPLLSPRDAALRAKQRISCYRLDARSSREPIFAMDMDDHGLGVAVPNAAGDDHNRTVRPHDFLRWCHVEAADFSHMVMTRRSTVLFFWDRPAILFVDREALDLGPALLCALENNGAVSLSHRVWAFSLRGKWDPHSYSAKALLVENHLISKLGLIKTANMKRGILDFLDEFGSFRTLIERFAPGYLDLEDEGHGMAYGYDDSRFRTEEQLEQLPPFRDDGW